MEKITDWTQIAWRSMLSLGESIMSALPSILGAIFLLILGWIVARIISFVIRKSLRLIGFDKLYEKLSIDELVNNANLNITPSKVIGKFVYWVIMLLFLVIASDTLGWVIVSQAISDLLIYVPKLLSAIVVFVVGLYIANFVKKTLNGILQSLAVSSGKMISVFAFYLIMIIISLTALSQAGIDTQVLTSNLSIVLGGFVLAFAVAFGLGAKNVLSNILSSFYSKSIFEAGQNIKMSDGLEGKIERIDSTSCVIITPKGKVVFPVEVLINDKIEIS